MLAFYDIWYKILYKLTDYRLRLGWSIRLGMLGKHSFLRAGVKVIGNPKRIHIGHHFKVYERVILSIGKGKIDIGNNGLIGVGTYLNCGNEKLSIGDRVAIAPFCKIFTYSHHYQIDGEMISTYKNGDVVIDDDVLIGTNSVIMPGVTIGKGAVIAASSVVTCDVLPNSIVGGIPAKLIKMK